MMKTKTRLFVSDMDGTLLQKDFTISEDNVAAIKELQKWGINFAVATGRIYHDAKTICSRYGLSPYIISNNGTCLYSTSGELLYSRPIPRDALGSLIQYLDQNEICYGIGTSRHYITSVRWEEVLEKEVKHLREKGIEIPFSKVDFAKKELALQNGVLLVDRMDKSVNEEGLACSISVVTFDQDKIERLNRKMKEYHTLMHVISGTHNLEITEKRGSKGVALEHLCGLLHLDMEQVAVIGDSLNDLSMFEKAGVKIAVENARKEVKDACDFVTKSHTCSGVAHAVSAVIGLTS